MICINCKSKLSCGCQKRVAADGKVVCSNCVTTYNNQLSINKNKAKNILAPAINNVVWTGSRN